MTRMRRLTVCLAALVAAAAACGGPSSGKHAASTATSTTQTSSSPTTSGMASLAAGYEAAVTPANAAVCRLQQQLPRMEGKSFSSTEPLATSTADAMDQAVTRLAQIDWPPSIKPDAVAMEQAAGTLSGDVRALPAQNATTFGDWTNRLESDGSKEKAAATTLRHDLGLGALPSACS